MWLQPFTRSPYAHIRDTTNGVRNNADCVAVAVQLSDKYEYACDDELSPTAGRQTKGENHINCRQDVCSVYRAMLLSLNYYYSIFGVLA